MRLLAFDTSTDVLSMAVQNDDWTRHLELAGGAKSSKVLLPQCMELLAQAQLGLAQLDAVVYGCGPGAFTGLRTSCAAAQGLAWGSGIQAVAVDSLLAIAEGARLAQGVERVVAVLDARMQEVYAAPFRWLGAQAGWIREADITAMAPAAVQVPEGYVLAGNAFSVYPAAFERFASAGLLHPQWPQALAMLSLAPALIAAGHLHNPQEIAPLYIRDKVAQTTQERMAAKLSESKR
ncbi:tRNA (adenosine(37)-N6)-threonylcarbamoyltransferase complex dimerization subunit type 1 TsaB [Lampropedia puyangensis]|uniref:tRNA (Adenosine(37)-N6)-threonylcarbamoyltransferase complex dimerization subunit type 1 TsaB n=1 Tax=Lampropedia puyangensis TaxID=1330072 RepID=A0A4S8FF87_9BURK|nr:tRNA (adenosine(37)-N6)-threonylcarbamoyltransferase complex dimerization subunit type 1 TsaB [Lampropedia puyangensis]THU05264.1 tRNA (adenosine(37)-N6)-threonylcarbamoyltransferase complex dimerization subunit type 1 TsaB [Lampropedia puyangensis]